MAMWVKKMKWFKHDSDASNDSKLKKLRLKYGAQGYGIYWYCLELIARNVEKHNLTFELEHDAELIADDFKLSSDLVQHIMTYMVELGLFENSTGVITCLKMATRTDEYTQQLIRSNKNSPDTIPRISLDTTDKVRGIRREENRIEEIRTEVGEVSKVIEYEIPEPPPPTEFTYSSQKFSMYGDWTPSDSFETLAKIAGMKLGDDYPVDEFLEFRTYWVTQPNMQRTQGEWEHAFIKSYKIKQLKGAKK
jgi:hypothetical protein